MLRPLRVREIFQQNCVACHSARRLGVTVSMEPAESQRTVERLATIRRMAALPGSGVRPDQVLAIAQAFETLMDDGDRDGAYQNTDEPAVQPRR